MYHCLANFRWDELEASPFFQRCDQTKPNNQIYLTPDLLRATCQRDFIMLIQTMYYFGVKYINGSNEPYVKTPKFIFETFFSNVEINDLRWFPSLLSNLRSSGQISFEGTIITPEQHRFIIMNFYQILMDYMKKNGITITRVPIAPSTPTMIAPHAPPPRTHQSSSWSACWPWKPSGIRQPLVAPPAINNSDRYDADPASGCCWPWRRR